MTKVLLSKLIFTKNTLRGNVEACFGYNLSLSWEITEISNCKWFFMKLSYLKDSESEI